MLSCTGSSCQHAVTPGCECGCGGANHGALARISWAAAMALPAEQRSPTQDKQVVRANTQRSRARSALKKQEESYLKLRKKPTHPPRKKPRRPACEEPRRADATAFFETNRSIDIVDWLVANPSERETLERMAHRVGDTCEEVLKKYPGTHRRLADHFWCDVLAALVQVLTEVLNEIDKMPGYVSKVTVSVLASRTWELVCTQRAESKGNAPCQRQKSLKETSRADDDAAAGLLEAVLEKAVENLVKALMVGVTEVTHGALGPIILRLRILAILFCPDPYAHKAVWEYCSVPLLKQEIVIRSECYGQHFFDMFKQHWHWRT